MAKIEAYIGYGGGCETTTGKHQETNMNNLTKETQTEFPPIVIGTFTN